MKKKDYRMCPRCKQPNRYVSRRLNSNRMSKGSYGESEYFEVNCRTKGCHHQCITKAAYVHTLPR